MSGITAILVVVGMLGLFALCYYLWQYCKKKFDNKFGKGKFEEFAPGLFLVILGMLFLVYGTIFDAHEYFECSHQSGKCLITTKNIFNQVVSRKEYDLKQIGGLSIESRTSSSLYSHSTYRVLNVLINGKPVEIPSIEWEPLDQQKAAFDEFLKNENIPDYKLDPSHGFIAWVGAGHLALGLFLLVSAVNLDEPILAMISKFLLELYSLLGLNKLVKLLEPVFTMISKPFQWLFECLGNILPWILVLGIYLVIVGLSMWIFVSGLHWLESPERNEHYAEVAAYQNGDFIRAEKLLLTKIQNQKGTSAGYLAYMHLARTLAKLGMNQQSSSALEKAADVATDKDLLLMDSADVYRIQKNYAESINLLGQLLEADPSSREMAKISELTALRKLMDTKDEPPENPIIIAIRKLINYKNQDPYNEAIKLDTTDFMKTYFLDFLKVPFFESKEIENLELITHKIYAYEQMSQVYHEAGDDCNMANCLEQALKISNEGNLYYHSITFANALADYYEKIGNLQCALTVRKQIPDWQKKLDQQEVEAKREAEQENDD